MTTTTSVFCSALLHAPSAAHTYTYIIYIYIDLAIHTYLHISDLLAKSRKVHGALLPLNFCVYDKRKLTGKVFMCEQEQ